MPTAALRYCSHPGCSEKTPAAVCPKHRRQSEQERGSAASRGYGGRWRLVRRYWLDEHPFCGDRLTGPSGVHSLCVTTAQGRNATLGDVVDHIIPHKGDQDLMWHESNFQTLCTTCHNRKTAREGGVIYKKTPGHRTVVTGVPGSGKTTWVKDRAKPGDLVWDLDAMGSTLALLPTFPRPQKVIDALLAMREGLLDYLAQESDISAFIIVTDPKEAASIAEQIHADVYSCGIYKR